MTKFDFKWLSRILMVLGMVLSMPYASASAQTRVVVTGEDSNKNSTARTDEVFRRVISQLQESMSRSGYQVIDEDMLGVKLGFSFNSRRPKTELIETLMLANQTEDATVQSRLAVVFAIFPQIKKMSVSRKLEVRIRGDIYDLESMRPLANFEYKNKKAILVPKRDCDSMCISEKLGENARDVAREVGDVIVQKLNIAVKQLGGGSSGSGGTGAASNMAIPKTFNLTLIRMKATQAVGIKQVLQSVDGISSLKTLSIQSSQRKMSLSTTLDIGMLEEMVLEAMMSAGIDINNVRIEMNANEIIVENLGS
ncbi:hypothetical protein N9X39_00730 [Alphaproteobacteria bacterium]|nr:hypothetical protein [Alphaproteobacteria bacterium]MDB3936746.1 hypothetical protein [bacterium]